MKAFANVEQSLYYTSLSKLTWHSYIIYSGYKQVLRIIDITKSGQNLHIAISFLMTDRLDVARLILPYYLFPITHFKTLYPEIASTRERML